MKKTIFYISSIIAIGLLTSQCNYHNVEEYFDISSNELCDTTDISFSDYIFPLIENNCSACHNSVTTYGGRNYDTFEGIKEVAETGLILNVLKHEPNFVQMPKNAAKLPDCNILKIEAWINQGIKNN